VLDTNDLLMEVLGLKKTHLATALGYLAVNAGYFVCFGTLDDLIRYSFQKILIHAKKGGYRAGLH